MIGLWLLVALFLDRAQLQISAFSYDSPFNGLGTVDLINQKTIKAPMAYRVLLPWFIRGIEQVFPRLERYRVTVYEVFKILFLTLALWACDYVLGIERALLIAALLPMTFAFDYWEWPLELMGYALALSGNIPLTCLGCLVVSLSRETAPLVPLTFILVSGNVSVGLQLFALTFAVLLAVRLYIGKRPLYCDRIMLKRNWSELKLFAHNHHPLGLDYSAYAVLLSVLTGVVVLRGAAGAAGLIPLLILGLGWTMGVARETRIFAPCLLWVAIGLIR